MIREAYRDLYIELTDDKTSFEVYELSPIFKEKAVITFGYYRESYTIDEIKEKIDMLYERKDESEE